MTAAGDGGIEGERTGRIAPAPWDLRADAYVFVLRSDVLRAPSQFYATSEQHDARVGPLAFALFVDYDSSPVGPYRELLFIPGTFAFGERRLPSITKIYVSTQASVENGRRNWGIPKEIAGFSLERRNEQLDHLVVRVDGKIAVEMTIKHAGPRFPLASWLLPPALRTLGQRLDGKTYEVTPRATARAQWASVQHAWADEAYFPALTPASIVATLKLSKVRLSFPEAVVR